jgi:hypothetical protein
VLGIVLLVAGVTWYLVDVGTFERRAHAVSASRCSSRSGAPSW